MIKHKSWCLDFVDVHVVRGVVRPLLLLLHIVVYNTYPHELVQAYRPKLCSLEKFDLLRPKNKLKKHTKKKSDEKYDNNKPIR